jgi:predicted ThiF/HesA family dinucleotide-utilizing enzyme
MARLKFSAHTGGAVAMVAATAKVVLQILAPTNQRIAVRGYSVSFDGVAGDAVPVLVEILRLTTAGTMAAGVTASEDALGSETIQTTATEDASAAPSAGTVLREYYIHPQTGADWRMAPDEEIIVPGAGRLGIRITAPAVVNVRPAFFCEE